jgi:hypothetical protein
LIKSKKRDLKFFDTNCVLEKIDIEAIYDIIYNLHLKKEKDESLGYDYMFTDL